MSDIITSIIEGIAKYNRATTKPYQKIHHIMGRESELQVPSDDESYIFRLTEGWKITFQNNESIIIKRN